MFNNLKVVVFPFLFIFIACDEQKISGCMDQNSCNYNSKATEDDGSCSNLDCNNVPCPHKLDQS